MAQHDVIVADAPTAEKEGDPNLEGAHSINNDQTQPQVSQEDKAKSVEPTSSTDYEWTARTEDSLDDDGTSTPKPIPNICLPAEILRGVKDLAPEDALNKLLSSYGAYIPTAADREKALQLEQEEHELRF
ncbi:hypothetical protein A2U01_0057499, partial [Trifolium medium]|nr:hypothetical protein [Trifolium medium]